MNETINKYYDECQIDYELGYRINKTLAIHYGYYDDKHLTHLKAVENMNKQLALLAQITSTNKVLDAGCGIGGSSIWLVRNTKATIVGININKNQLNQAQAFAISNNVSNKISFELGNYSKTKFDDKSFSVVWGLESICYAKDKKKFIQEAFRILKPKGRLIVADGFQTSNNLNIIQKKHLKLWLEGWAVTDLSTVTDFHKHLHEIGFKKITYKNITKNVTPTSKGLFLASILSTPIAKIMELFGLRKKTQAANRRSAYHQYKALQLNAWEYGIFVAQK